MASKVNGNTKATTAAINKGIKKLAPLGFNKKEIATALGYSSDHFYQLLKNSGELTSTYNVCRSNLKSLLLNRHLAKALDDTHRDSFKATESLLGRLDKDSIDEESKDLVELPSDADIASSIIKDLS